MPLKGLHANLRRRRSNLDPSNLAPPNQDDAPQRGTVSAEFLSHDRPVTPRNDSSRDVRRVSTLMESSPARTEASRPSEDSSLSRRSAFNFYKWRHASDSHLAAKARKQREQDRPPVPALPLDRDPPAIVMTAPTTDETTQQDKRKSKFPLFARPKSPQPFASESKEKRKSMDKRRAADRRRTMLGGLRNFKDSSEFPDRGAQSLDLNGLIERGQREGIGSSLAPPSGDGDEHTQSTDHGEEHSHSQTHQRPPVTHHSKSWLPRRRKNRTSLFPLPVKISPPQLPNTAPATPRASTGGRSSGSPNHSPNRSPGEYSPPLTSIRRTSTADGHDIYHLPLPSPPHAALAATSVQFAAPGSALLRNDSTSVRSERSTTALAPPMPFRLRNRSSTQGSTGARSEDGPAPPPTPPTLGGGSGRNSTSTAGRSSFSNLLTIGHRFRQGSDPHSPRQGSPALGINGGASGLASHTNSFQISREALKVTLPERSEGESAGKYLSRVEDCIDRSQIPSVLSKQTDEFSLAVMRSFMRKFAFFGDPLDMAVRKLLMEVDLPKETQQIDRVLQSFADRYHECNPGIFIDSEKAYFIAFSVLILHTDVFNKNNKRKMTKPDYLKISSVEGVSDEVLSCFYDNTSYTPFIRVEDEIELKSVVRKSKKTLTKHGTIEQLKKTSKEPLDPYTLILEGKLDVLRPPLKDVMNLDDPYSYLGTASTLDIKDLNKNTKCGVLQIESLRSRPDAFLSPSTIDNPEEAKSGLVDLPVDKVGILWRKDPKKKAARSPWQEWGAILTASGLSFFRNAGWVKNLMHQYDSHKKHAHGGGSVIFRPPIQMFKPDYFLPTENGVALHDSGYRRHKNGFVFFTHSGTEEVFLADNESELNHWLAKLNHQASYRTVGIRPRGLVGGNYEGQRQRALRRLQSSNSTRTVQTPTGEVTIQSGNIDFLLAQQISVARRENMQIKIDEFEERLSLTIKQLDNQLRDARHLLILAPIQQKTREQLVHAAGRIAAQLKWVRIDMWRMKCHRDILALDLDEENKLAGNVPPARSPRLYPQSVSPTPSSTNSTERLARVSGLLRLGSSTSADAEEHTVPKSPTQSFRPHTNHTAESSQDTEPSEEEDYRTPLESNTPQPSPAFPPAVWGPITPRGSLAKETSGGSQLSRSPITDTTIAPSIVSSPTELPPDSPNASEYNSPLSETRDSGHKPKPHPSSLDGRPRTASDSEPEPTQMAGSPESKSKPRRSLQRTLREVRDSPLGHHRSRKGKDSNSSAVLSDSGTVEEESEGLPRTRASFTVHGKKASVITFGSDWQDMSPEEKLRLRKQAQAPSSELAIIPTISADVEIDSPTVKKPDEARSVSSARSVPGASRGRRGSDATAKSEVNAQTPAPSIRERTPASSIRERMAARKHSYQTTRGLSRTSSRSMMRENEEKKEEQNKDQTTVPDTIEDGDLKRVASPKAQAVEV